MKYSVILVSLLLSSAALANETRSFDYIGCTHNGANEYNVVLEVDNGQLKAISTLEGDAQDYRAIKADEKVAWVLYLTEYDTNLHYAIKTNGIGPETGISILPWISGNDSDNYHGYPDTEQDIVCHLLKTKPANSILSPANYKASIPVNRLAN